MKMKDFGRREEYAAPEIGCVEITEISALCLSGGQNDSFEYYDNQDWFD